MTDGQQSDGSWQKSFKTRSPKIKKRNKKWQTALAQKKMAVPFIDNVFRKAKIFENGEQRPLVMQLSSFRVNSWQHFSHKLSSSIIWQSDTVWEREWQGKRKCAVLMRKMKMLYRMDKRRTSTVTVCLLDHCPLSVQFKTNWMSTD